MIKKNTAVIVGLTSITLFAGCLTLINHDDNQKKILAESTNLVPSSQFSNKVTATDQRATNVISQEQSYANVPTVMPANTPATPLPIEQPSAAPLDVTMNPPETLSQPIKVAPTAPTPEVTNNLPQTASQSVKAVPPAPAKTKTTKTRAS